MARYFTASTDLVNHGSGASLDDLFLWTTCSWVFVDSGTFERRFWQKGVLGTDGFFCAYTWTNTDNHTGTWDRSTTDLLVSASSGGGWPGLMASFPNKWLFTCLQIDTSVDLNNKLFMGTQIHPPIEAAAYGTQTAGSGTVASNAAVNLTVGNKSNNNTPLAGSLAWMGMWPRLLNVAELTKVWETTRWTTGLGVFPPSNLVLPPGPVLNVMYDALALDLSPYGSHGTYVGTTIRPPHPQLNMRDDQLILV